MTQHIGLVACAAEGAALCYRTICEQDPLTQGAIRDANSALPTLDSTRLPAHAALERARGATTQSAASTSMTQNSNQPIDWRQNHQNNRDGQQRKVS